jgi:inositol-phosphate phosphatase / L-galactose 1-phosphate phosphatase / histidinol-phosphatase
MTGPGYDEFVELGHALVDAAGAIQRRYFRTAVAVDLKADQSPVTAADREAEAAMRDLIARRYPHHGIFGEEFGASDTAAEFVWVLDPIDGTKSFITGRPLFGTLVGLLHDGRPVLGLIDQSIIADRWVGVMGEGAWHNARPIRTRACSSLARSVLFTTSPLLFPTAGHRAAYERVQERVGLPMFGGDCYAYGLLASGFADLVVEAGLKPYDFTALVAVVAGAGGKITDWRGRPLGLEADGTVVAAGDPGIHKEALALLADYPG